MFVLVVDFLEDPEEEVVFFELLLDVFELFFVLELAVVVPDLEPLEEEVLVLDDLDAFELLDDV